MPLAVAREHRDLKRIGRGCGKWEMLQAGMYCSVWVGRIPGIFYVSSFFREKVVGDTY